MSAYFRPTGRGYLECNQSKSLGSSLGSVDKNDRLVMSAKDAELEDVGMTGTYHFHSLAEEAQKCTVCFEMCTLCDAMY